MSIKNLARG